MKVSRKLLKQLVEENGPLGYDDIVDQLDEDQTDYTNESVLKGLLQDCLDKNLIVMREGQYVRRPRGSTGGQPPTHMYLCNEHLSIEKRDIDDAVLAQEKTLWRTTPLAAIKARKTYFYNRVYKPTMNEIRQLEKQHQVG